jgi:dGTPase
MSDIVAYVNHDTTDAIRAGMIAENELPASAVRLLGHTSSGRINTLVSDIISCSLAHMGDVNLTKPVIGINTEILEAANSLREFLFDKVYNPSLANKDTAKAQKVIRLLYSYLLKHEGTLPREYALRDDTVERKITDYIAGMTDHYAIRMAKEVSR